MLQPYALRKRDCPTTDRQWSQMVRGACRMLVLVPAAAEAITVSAVFADQLAARAAADAAAHIVAEYALEAELSWTTVVSARIARRPSVAIPCAIWDSSPTRRPDRSRFGVPFGLRRLLGR